MVNPRTSSFFLSLRKYYVDCNFVILTQKAKNFTAEDVEAYKYAMCQSGMSGPVNYYRNIMLPDPGLPRGYTHTKIKAPTLVVWVRRYG